MIRVAVFQKKPVVADHDKSRWTALKALVRSFSSQIIPSRSRWSSSASVDDQQVRFPQQGHADGKPFAPASGKGMDRSFVPGEIRARQTSGMHPAVAFSFIQLQAVQSIQQTCMGESSSSRLSSWER